MKEGRMVSMDVTMDLLKNAMLAKKGAKGYLIDGFPRTMEQAKAVIRQINCSLNLKLANALSSCTLKRVTLF